MNVRFNVQSYYAVDTHFPYKSIWGAKASKKKITFFVLTANYKKLLTCDNLMKR